ncbi:hypothetical protein [Flavobacterium turcicum]|uniref:Uncharacterized protein n=1 Tax=Flavobacterium turcicum TaxID=2764718 RepID=A0ABR7JEU9_9FLAO|nr:hypothetical protein [Flavobacterium turcicum]MBC5862840.1 hypothetical protein [Flavobacterium turcicum]NHL01572.1 hypothetical protein [Flavobacterium turcicum]
MNRMQTHEDIYEKVSSFFNIKFKAQLKDSPIEFENFLLVKNLITENENYVICLLNRKEVLKFKDRDELIIKFIDYIDFRISEFQDKFEELNNFEISRSGIIYDENEVFILHENIGHGLYKLNQIKEKFIKMKL